MQAGAEPHRAGADLGHQLADLVEVDPAAVGRQAERPEDALRRVGGADALLPVALRPDQVARLDGLPQLGRGGRGVGDDLEQVVVQHLPAGRRAGLDVEDQEPTVVAPDLVERPLDDDLMAGGVALRRRQDEPHGPLDRDDLGRLMTRIGRVVGEVPRGVLGTGAGKPVEAVADRREPGLDPFLMAGRPVVGGDGGVGDRPGGGRLAGEVLVPLEVHQDVLHGAPVQSVEHRAAQRGVLGAEQGERFHPGNPRFSQARLQVGQDRQGHEVPAIDRRVRVEPAARGVPAPPGPLLVSQLGRRQRGEALGDERQLRQGLPAAIRPGAVRPHPVPAGGDDRLRAGPGGAARRTRSTWLSSGC